MKYCTVCKAKYEDNVSFCPVDGEVLEDDPSSIVNTVLDGQYQIESMLGKGGMGAVYGARHILLGDKVAIKILPPEVRNNAEWLRRFRREGQAARRFRHPNSVTVYDLRTAADGTIYMVMEYVEGHTLDAEIKQRGSFSPAEALAVLEPILSVLNTAHSMGVVHRDLKPENIMIGRSAETKQVSVKLLDLGIAKMREIAGADNGGTTALTMAGQVLGTPYYMSPEQWGEIPRDGNPEIDGRADIYSLGLVFYEMIAGRRPCSGTTLSELRREHVSEVLKPLHEAVPGVPLAFSLAISRATAKDRGDRPSTAGELEAELKAAVGNETAWTGRTLPDIPFPQASAQTGDIKPASDTKSDVDAPTVMTLDSAQTGGLGPATPTSPKQGAPAKRAPLPAPFGEGPKPEPPPPTVFGSGDMSSSVTMQQPARQASAQLASQSMPLPPHAAEPAKKSSSALFIGVGAIILVLVVLVGGFFAYSWLKPKSSNTANTTNTTAPVTTSTTAQKDFGRYWLEVLPASLGADPLRVAGVVPLASGQPFKFHFQIESDGYLYVVGPGENNQLTAFLTAKPASISGVDSNHVAKQSDFSFPSGIDHWLELDKKPGSETYTIVFSSSQLTQPSFFAEQVTGKPLSASEQSDFKAFVAKYPAQPSTEVNDKDNAQPFVQVRVPANAAASVPTIFQIRIEHK